MKGIFLSLKLYCLLVHMDLLFYNNDKLHSNRFSRFLRMFYTKDHNNLPNSFPASVFTLLFFSFSAIVSVQSLVKAAAPCSTFMGNSSSLSQSLGYYLLLFLSVLSLRVRNHLLTVLIFNKELSSNFILLLWRNTLTKSNLGRRGFIFLPPPGHSPSLRGLRAGSQDGNELETRPMEDHSLPSGLLSGSCLASFSPSPGPPAYG